MNGRQLLLRLQEKGRLHHHNIIVEGDDHVDHGDQAKKKYPLSMAALKIRNFPVNPIVGGIPPRLNTPANNPIAKSGERR